MNRLTRYDKKQKHYVRLASRLAVDNTLGKLEDIEQDLECPLDVVFKALKGINYENEFGDFCRCQRPNLYYSDVLKCWCLESYLACQTLPLKDYKKTWWLSETKEE